MKDPLLRQRDPTLPGVRSPRLSRGYRGRLVAALLLAVSAAAGCGDPGYTEFVINHSDREFILRYEDKLTGGPTFEFKIPAESSGTTLGGLGPDWHGVVVVMTSECAQLGRVAISANPTLLIIEADGTFSMITEHIRGRTDTDATVIFGETDHCPG